MIPTDMISYAIAGKTATQCNGKDVKENFARWPLDPGMFEMPICKSK